MSKTVKKKTPKIPCPTPAAVAARIAEDFASQLSNYHSQAVALLDDVRDGVLLDAVQAHRHAMEAAGKWKKGTDAESDHHDARVTGFQLGYALGARFGGAR